MANLSQDKTVRCIHTKTQKVRWFSPFYLSKLNNVKYLEHLGYVIDDHVQKLEAKLQKKVTPKKEVETVKEDITIDETSEPTFNYPVYDDITANEIKVILEDKKIEYGKYDNKTTLYNLLTGKDES